MRIQHNIMAMSAYRNYTNNVSAMKKNLEKLSSGYKINRAGDDAAGLAISEKMRAQITGLETAQKNAKDGISLVQTAEGALTEVHDMLNRMVELATQSANGTYDNTTDRAQMQKEVNQLLEEIDRIADSSNFNGINLLDGSLGLNKDAFAISSLDAVKATDGTIDLSEALAAKDADYSDLHLEGSSKTAVAPTVTIDLGTLEFDAKASGDKLAITIGGQKFELVATSTKVYKTADLGGLLETALKKAGTSGSIKGITASGTATTTGVGLRIGNAGFTIGNASGATVTLTYAGRYDKSTDTQFAKKETAFTGSEDLANSINDSIGFAVEVGDITSTTGSVKTGDVIHDSTQVTRAVAKKDASLAGIDLDLSKADIVKDGNKLVIDGKSYIFKVGSGSTVVKGTNEAMIDLSKYEADDADLIHAAADALSKIGEKSGQEGRKWKIGVENGSIIHIEQTNKSNTGKELKTYDDLTGVISAKGDPVTAANAGTKIAVTKDALKEGNTLNIDGEKFSFSKDFSDVDSLVTAIKGNKTLSAKYDVAASKDGNSVEIRSKTVDGTGPMVLGKGLTLQIGDTADSWNQLNVAVQDMHSGSLGIGKLDISTEEAAQAAIDKIKAAINTVSDVRGTLGATQNRLDHTINNLSVMTENIQDAESTIRDVDVAEEMMAYTKNNILIQSAQAMLAQANQVPQGVLQLLQ